MVEEITPGEPGTSNGAIKSEALELVVKGVVPTKSEKISIVNFVGHTNWRVKCWNSSEFFSALVTGAAAKGLIERVPSTNPAYPDPELWLREWNGVGERQAAKGAKGANGYRPAPDHVTLGPMAGVAMQVAVQYNAPTLDKVMEDADAIFDRMLAMVKRGKGKL